MQVQERNWIMTEFFFPENKKMILRAKPVVTRSRRAFCRYFSRDGEIRHNNQGLLRAPHPTFCSDRSVLDDSDFLSFGLAGLCLLKISFTA